MDVFIPNFHLKRFGIVGLGSVTLRSHIIAHSGLSQKQNPRLTGRGFSKLLQPRWAKQHQQKLERVCNTYEGRAGVGRGAAEVTLGVG